MTRLLLHNAGTLEIALSTSTFCNLCCLCLSDRMYFSICQNLRNIASISSASVWYAGITSPVTSSPDRPGGFWIKIISYGLKLILGHTEVFIAYTTGCRNNGQSLPVSLRNLQKILFMDWMYLSMGFAP